MSQKLQIKLDFDQDLTSFFKQKYPEYSGFRILSQSLDARGAPRGKKPVSLYQIEAIKAGEKYDEVLEKFSNATLSSRPIIVGAGPAGLFCALRFSEYNVPTTIIERGDVANKRMLAISKYWRKGILDPDNNVCFGEGGAGLFSDGKLITRIKSSFIKYVMKKFVEFGAPSEVEYVSNPHLGSNKIRKIISAVTDDLKKKGTTFYYNNKVTKLLFDGKKVIGVELKNGEKLFSEYVILATGHSAKEMYFHLQENAVAMAQKDFAVGVRIEHPRAHIDKLQYGTYADTSGIGAARYRLSYHNQNSEKGTYSFCMCPGGHVLSSGTDIDGVVANGMSNYSRSAPWSNSALVVSIKKGEDFSDDNLLAGHEFQRKIEKAAFNLSLEKADGRALPAISVKEFVTGTMTDKPLPKSSCPSGLFKANFALIFPSFILKHLKDALIQFDKSMPGFIDAKAVLIAPETRTSAPISILRDKHTFESLSHQGLYPCGEGAGHAGGITSAAVDGVKVCEAIVNKFL